MCVYISRFSNIIPTYVVINYIIRSLTDELEKNKKCSFISFDFKK